MLPSFAVVALATSTVAKLVTALPAPGTFTFYDMPTALAGPCDQCEGPDGALWVQDILVNKIARIDPKTGKVDEYDIPYTTPAANLNVLPGGGGRTALACAIRPGRDGYIYAASGIRNQLVQINPTTRKIRVFTPQPYNPAGDLQPFNDLYAGPTGMFFSQTTANILTHFDYNTHNFTNYVIPTPEGSPLGVFYFRDFAWTAEFLGQKIARLNATSGEFVEYPLPATLLGPAVIRVGLHNPDRICFTAFLGDAIGCLGVDDGAITVYPNGSPLAFPAEDTLDSKGNIWFSTASQNYLNKLDPKTGAITRIVQPGTLVAAPVSLPLYFDIGINYGPGNAIWFTEATTNQVGRYQLP